MKDKLFEKMEQANIAEVIHGYQCKICFFTCESIYELDWHFIEKHEGIIKNLSRKDCEELIEFYMNYVNNWFDNIEKEYKNDKNQFLSIAEADLIHTLIEKTEQMFKKEGIYRRVKAILYDMNQYKIKYDDWIFELRENLDRQIKNAKQRYLKSETPQFDKTLNIMTNAMRIWTYEINVYLWGNINSPIWELKRILDILCYFNKLVFYMEGDCN